MTIFDSIKYPIPDVPTSDEIWDLPDYILLAWQERVGNGMSIHALVLAAESGVGLYAWHLQETIKYLP